MSDTIEDLSAETRRAWQQFSDAVHREIDGIDRQIEQCRDQIRQLLEKRQVLVDRLDAESGETVEVTVERVDATPRMRLLRDYIRQHGEATLDDLEAELRRLGRDDPRRLISSTINGLRTRGEIERVADSTYRYVGE